MLKSKYRDLLKVSSVDIRRRSVLAGSATALVFPRLTRAAAKPLVAPIKLIGRRVTIGVNIGGMGGSFAIDSGGAMSLINESVARDLGLPEAGDLRIGVAGTPVLHRIFVAPELTIGGIIVQHHVRFVAVPGSVLGDGISGSISSGLVTTRPCLLDFDALQWCVWNDSRPTFSDYTRLKALAVDAKPGFSPMITAAAQVNGSPVRCVIDTGGESFVRLNRSMAEHLGLWTDARPYAPVAQGGRIVRVDTLSFGGVLFERPLALLLSTDRNTDISDGLIGLPTLRRFNIGFDLDADALWLRRNSLPAPDYRCALSGLAVSEIDHGLHVDDVGSQSPAADAGLIPGDVIETSEPANVIRQLNASAGEEVTFRVQRGASRRVVTLRMSDYL
ncbi:MAG: aspartyl protease family protein [Gluconobacter sp.]|uniref:aspartyl protease family protein n=1 Tax=Gluconobacter sp. TaxID=1876758 RepID=UPI0039E96BF3